MNELRPLSLAALEIRMHSESGMRLPEYSGALFRGGFGKYLRELVCRTRAPQCTGCEYLTKCAYGVVFETAADPASSVLLKAYPFAPHPFVLTPPLGDRASPVGNEFSLQLCLIGRGRGYLAHFIEGLGAMGRSGRFGGRYGIVEIREATGTRERIFDGPSRRLLRPVPESTNDGVVTGRRLRLEFETPLRLRERGEYTKAPSFAVLIQALVRRIHMVGCAHGGWPDDLAWRQPLLEAADRVRTLACDWEEFRWQRHSGRQQRTIPMDGVRGFVEVEGDLEALGPALSLGRHLHIGSGTAMGMGRYRLEVLG